MSVVKMVAAIPRRKDLSEQEFHDHWRHPHGTISRQMLTLRAYVQSHRTRSQLLPQEQEIFDGITEVWFDNLSDALGVKENPAYLRYNGPDEPRFVDMERLIFVFVTEEVLASRANVNTWPNEADVLWSPWHCSVSVKLIQLIEAAGGTDWTSSNDESLGIRIGALRHVRSRPIAAIHGDKPPFVGIRELWWPTLTAFEKGVKSDRPAFEQLISKCTNAKTLLCQAERVI
ncbi:MAG TPA: EthD domain-containing protein [Steroidobacteraceae bacterium]